MIRITVALLAFGITISRGVIQAQTPAQMAELRPCQLPSGANLEVCRIGYRTFGKRNGANAILVPTWLAGRSADWHGLLGPGLILDTTRYYVIVVDALGNGISSSPSNTIAFPRITIEDMVETQFRLARDVLGFTRLRGVVGVSMGGIQVFEWAAAHPGFVDRFVSIVGTPQAARHDRAWLETEVRAVDAGKTYHIPEDTVWRLIAGVAVLTDVQETVNARPAAEADSLLAAEAAAAARSVHLDDLAAQARAILAYDYYKRPGSESASAGTHLRGRFLVINSPDDRLISAGPPLAFARRAGLDTLVLRSSCGHGVFFCEAASIGAAVQAFLAR